MEEYSVLPSLRPFVFTTLVSIISYSIMFICLLVSFTPYSKLIPYAAGTILPTTWGILCIGVVITYFFSSKIVQKYGQTRTTLVNADLRGHWLPAVGILSLYLLTKSSETPWCAYTSLAAFVVALILPFIYFGARRRTPRQVYPGVPRGVVALYIIPALLGCLFVYAY